MTKTVRRGDYGGAVDHGVVVEDGARAKKGGEAIPSAYHECSKEASSLGQMCTVLCARNWKKSPELPSCRPRESPSEHEQAVESCTGDTEVVVMADEYS